MSIYVASPLRKAIFILAKAVTYKFLGERRTEEFIQLIKDFREPETPVPDQMSDDALRSAAETAAAREEVEPVMGYSMRLDPNAQSEGMSEDGSRGR